MDEKKPKERIVLRNNQQTTIAITVPRQGKYEIEPGATIRVASSAATIISARFNPETGVVDVVPIEGALGPSDVSVAVTLADGTVLPPRAVEYMVVHPDAEAVVLTPGAISDKQTIITVPVPNAEPHVVPAPEEKAEPGALPPPEHEPPPPEETHDPETRPHGHGRHHRRN
jgi:hypothetical protein